MKIFVGYGYNERDLWIERLVFPIIEAMGNEVVTGKDLYGLPITSGVGTRIKESNAVIGFTTRRDQLANGEWTTHQWVKDELLHGLACNLLILEVREQGVQAQDGMLGGLQRISYLEPQREVVLMELVKAICQWKQGGEVRMQLLPQDFVREIWTLLRSTELRCTYRFMVNYREGPDMPAKILQIGQGLYIMARNVPRQALIQVQVQHRDRTWSSSYQTTDSLDVVMERS